MAERGANGLETALTAAAVAPILGIAITEIPLITLASETELAQYAPALPAGQKILGHTERNPPRVLIQKGLDRYVLIGTVAHELRHHWQYRQGMDNDERDAHQFVKRFMFQRYGLRLNLDAIIETERPT
jgi:uncharacterized protein DUF6782